MKRLSEASPERRANKKISDSKRAAHAIKMIQPSKKMEDAVGHPRTPSINSHADHSDSKAIHANRDGNAREEY